MTQILRNRGAYLCLWIPIELFHNNFFLNFVKLVRRSELKTLRVPQTYILKQKSHFISRKFWNISFTNTLMFISIHQTS